MLNKTCFILLFLMLLALGSCRAKRQVSQTASVNEKSFVEKKVLYRDTVLFTKASQSSLAIPVNAFKKCSEDSFQQSLKPVETKPEKPKTYSQKNGNATVTVKYVHDTIQVTAECDSLAIEAKIKQEYESKFQTKENTTIKEDHKKTGSFFGGFTWVLGALAVGFILGKIIKI